VPQRMRRVKLAVAANLEGTAKRLDVQPGLVLHHTGRALHDEFGQSRKMGLLQQVRGRLEQHHAVHLRLHEGVRTSAHLQAAVGQVCAHVVDRQGPAIGAGHGKAQAVGLEAVAGRAHLSVLMQGEVLNAANLGIGQGNAVGQQARKPGPHRILALKIVGSEIAGAREKTHGLALFGQLLGDQRCRGAVLRPLVGHQHQVIGRREQVHGGDDVGTGKRIDHLARIEPSQMLFGPDLHRCGKPGAVVRCQLRKSRALLRRQHQLLQQTVGGTDGRAGHRRRALGRRHGGRLRQRLSGP
jgi:hypothetical protein